MIFRHGIIPVPSLKRPARFTARQSSSHANAKGVFFATGDHGNFTLLNTEPLPHRDPVHYYDFFGKNYVWSPKTKRLGMLGDTSKSRERYLSEAKHHVISRAPNQNLHEFLRDDVYPTLRTRKVSPQEIADLLLSLFAFRDLPLLRRYWAPLPDLFLLAQSRGIDPGIILDLLTNTMIELVGNRPLDVWWQGKVHHNSAPEYTGPWISSWESEQVPALKRCILQANGDDKEFLRLWNLTPFGVFRKRIKPHGQQNQFLRSSRHNPFWEERSWDFFFGFQCTTYDDYREVIANEGQDWWKNHLVGKHKDGLPTEAMPYFLIAELLALGGFDSDAHVVDMGSGEGRLGLCLAMRKLSRMSLVEIDGEILKTAEKNHQAARSFLDKDTPIEMIQADVGNDGGKLDEIYATANRFVFYNPFGIKTLATFLGKLYHSLQEHPRTVRLYFFIPQDFPEIRILLRGISWLHGGLPEDRWNAFGVWTNERKGTPS